MASDTRERLLDTATELFAERGFEGVSIARIAETRGLSKQALLHHFSTKERLYGEVLGRISTNFEALLRHLTMSPGDVHGLVDVFLRLADESHQASNETGLLIRELLDNRERASHAAHWYLKPFLDSITDQVLALPAWRRAERPTALAAVYQILGAINYFAISRNTLEGMFGQSVFARIEAAHALQLKTLISNTLNAGPAEP